MTKHLSADALDDDSQFQLNVSGKRRLPSGSDDSDLDKQRIVAVKKKKKNRRQNPRPDINHIECKAQSAESPLGQSENIKPSAQKQKVSQLSHKKPHNTPKSPLRGVLQHQKTPVKKKKAKPSTDVKKAPAQVELGSLACAPGEDISIGLQPPDLQLSYLSDRQKRALPRLSDLELEPLRFHQSWLQEVSKRPQRADLGSWLNAGSIPDLLETIKVKTEVPGSPAVLVVTSAALRAVDLCRQTKPLVPSPKTTGGVAKLFARHFKLQQHITHLNSTPVALGIGTPDRISKLIDAKALKLDQLRWILLDVTWLDAKSYSLADLPDAAVRQALWQGILGNPGLLAMLKMGRVKLVLF